MKATFLTLAVAALICVGCTQDGQSSAEASGGVATNKMCAIMDTHPVDPKVVTVYKGKTIAFCCAECIPEFKKDPEKYVASLK